MLPSAKIDAKIPHKNKLQVKYEKQKQKHEDQYDDVHKKLMRRYTEKLRRQEMATLSASLRSLLPLHYLKGKRSMSDQINEAAKYIKHLQNRIGDLGAKRDKLRMFSSSSNLNNNNNNNNDNNNVGVPEIGTLNKKIINVSVSECLGGFEVVAVSNSITAQMLPLSTLLDVLLKHGLSIVNCVYAKLEEGRKIYTIRTQVSDPLGIDLSTLQRKLEEALPSSSNSSICKC